jgi:hypothetical protein
VGCYKIFGQTLVDTPSDQVPWEKKNQISCQIQKCKPSPIQSYDAMSKLEKKSIKVPALYVRTVKITQAVCAGELPKLRGQSEENSLTISSLISSTISASTAACHARGLVIVHSRKLSVTLGGSTSTRPWVRKLIVKTCDFVDINKTAIPATLGGSTTTSPPIVVVILRQ